MVIAAVDTALTSLLRAALPLPEEVGDIAFDVPDRGWGSQLSQITVNLYLFDVARSTQPSRPAAERIREDGRIERRAPLPMVRLGYMVTAWAGSVPDEHQLLSELLAVFVTHQVIPEQYLPESFGGAVQLAISARDGRRPGDLWNGLEGRMKPVIELEVTVPMSSEPWRLAPPAVERIAGLVAPTPEGFGERVRPARSTQVRRTAEGALEAVALPPDAVLPAGQGA